MKSPSTLLITTLILLVNISVHTSSYGQILNAEKFYQEVDSIHSVKGAVDLGLSTIKQTYTLHRFYSKVNMTQRLGKSDFTLAGSTQLLISQGENLINRSFVHLRYRTRPHNTVTPEFFSQYQWDGIRGLKSRLLLGTNARIKVNEDDAGGLNVGIGTMYETEGWNFSGSSDATIKSIDTLVLTHVAKYNLYVGAFRKVTPTLTIGLTSYLQGKYVDPIHPRLAGIANIDLLISKNLSYSIAFDWYYDSKPVVPIQNLYYTLQNKIVFNIAPAKEKCKLPDSAG